MASTRLALLAGFAACLLAWACSGGGEIVVGFAGQLTGAFSDLGVQGRNGATLALEEINDSGGLAGKRLTMVAVDDRNTPQGAVAAVDELAGKKPVAILGFMTSSQTMAALPAAEAAGIPLVSPTTATPALTGKKDGFFRVIQDNSGWARDLARYATRELGLSRVFVLGDTDNAAYVNTFNQAFLKAFTEAGGTVNGQTEFSATARPDWMALVLRAAATDSQAVLVNASARDVAEFAKARALAGTDLTILCPAWAYSKEILLVGGASVEGIVFIAGYTDENDSPHYQNFKKRYEARFGWSPNFAAAYGYEAMTVLAKALERTGGKRQGLTEALASVGEVRGVLGDFTLDKFGDVDRASFLVTIRDGRFVTITDAGR